VHQAAVRCGPAETSVLLSGFRPPVASWVPPEASAWVSPGASVSALPSARPACGLPAADRPFGGQAQWSAARRWSARQAWVLPSVRVLPSVQGASDVPKPRAAACARAARLSAEQSALRSTAG
jgi:hypothetical protein